MEELRIGVVGTGAIGRKHVRRITERLKGGKVVAVSDANLAGAQAVAAEYGAELFEDGGALIASPGVDAVIVTAWDPAHKEYVMDAVRAGKYVFCEKPLATTAADCREIVEAEQAGGKRLVQVGFMRRYDEGYRRMKEAVDGGFIGAPLMVHCAHRNASMDPEYEDDYMITQCCIHEIDLVKWLIDDEYESVRVLLPRSTKFTGRRLHDPQIAQIRTKKGVCIDVEIFVNCQFGYDIQCQVVGECGAVNLPDPSYLPYRKGAVRGAALCTNWEDRFVEAYNVELQEWIDATRAGRVDGPNAWDGYVAAVTADAMIRAREAGEGMPVDLPERPAFYR